jgi:beta-phosphoglucomutase-like phosphatase (HAD superfamily)
MQYIARIFDFDGTLVDTGDLNVNAVHAALRVHGVDVASRTWLHTVPLADLAVLRQRLEEDFATRLDCSDRALVTCARDYWIANVGDVRAIAGMVAVARDAAAIGPVGVASANDGLIVRAGLTAIGLAEAITVVVARDDVAHLKPAPDAYLLAASRLGVDPEQCLAYEDTAEGIAAACAAGMDVLDIRTDTLIRSAREV